MPGAKGAFIISPAGNESLAKDDPNLHAASNFF